MRKRTIIISLVCVLSAVIVIMIFAAVRGRKPYKDLEAVQIVSATVRLSPPDKTIQITEIKELVDLLKEVVIYNEDNLHRVLRAGCYLYIGHDGWNTNKHHGI